LADKTPVITIVGGESLLGRELSDVLASKDLPAHVNLVSAEQDDAASGIMTEAQGEPVFMVAFNAGELSGSRIILLAGTPESSVKVAESSRGANAPILVDVTGALEDRPEARLRAPLTDQAGQAPAPIYVIAHPAAIALSLFLKRLAAIAAVRRVVADIFEPVSERGKQGLDELQQQTVSLLSFQKMKQEIFDTQVSFNMLPRYGEDAVRSLEDVETTIERHLATLLGSGTTAPMPSLRVIHAPVFHAYSASLWVEFENRPAAEELAGALAGAQIEVRSNDQEPPSNVGAAGQSGITVGCIAPDRNDPRACWFWMVADNLRIAADNAVEVVRELLA
jgi:aspartate-semialdehyde dehydrogenase